MLSSLPDPDSEIPFRMADYRLRVFRRYPQKQMRQVVVYLRKTGSQLVRQTVFEISGLRHSFEVIRLWEQPTSAFLGSPGLLPFAVLSQTDDRAEVLREVARRTEVIANRRELPQCDGFSGAIGGFSIGEGAYLSSVEAGHYARVSDL